MIETAVIPVAGFGTRMLPISKSIPKELIPLLDKPVIQYVVEEAIAAGIKKIVFVNHAQKTSIENYFDTNAELEAQLEAKGKTALLEAINPFPVDIHFTSVRQAKGQGLGHAVLCAKPVVGSDDFAVLLPDVVINPFKSSLEADNLAAMVKLFNDTAASQILVEAVADKDVSKYGIADIDGELTAGASTSVKGFVEKPDLVDAPSNLAIVGRYVFDNQIFGLLEQVKPDKSGEIQLTDAIDALISQKPVEVHSMVGKSHDNGNKLTYVQTFIEFAKAHPDYKDLV
ncbi:MAG: UTP--glucose-1-phosphate uridylyltransferase [Pseudomonadota bacterium]|nr:UTP--glucose-1-phosphate uridylyltransferase [Pseudomonadota bacterium]